MQNDISPAKALKWFAAAAFAFVAVSGQVLAQDATPPGGQANGAAAIGQRGLPSITGLTPDPQAARRPWQAQTGNKVQAAQQDPNAQQKDEELFSKYVETVTGARLPIFGKNLFSGVPTTFSPSDTQQVNADYVIGSGDEIQIRGWGMINVDLNATVDRGGSIYIPSVGSVKVAGVKYRDLQGYLKQAVSKFYSNFELTASIAQTRAVQVYVVGHAVRPGTYTLSSMSTLLNALFTSGGPDSSGSMRNVQLKRGGQTITTFDLYDMLVRGDKSHDVSLHDGDVIFIPEAGPLVALTGNVKVPAIYELQGQSSVGDLVRWAGGVESAAEGKRVIVERTVDNVYQTVAELSGDSASVENSLANIALRAADVIRVFSPNAVPVQAQIKHEYVRVAGEVRQGGVFELHKGETLRELMARLGGTTDSGYLYAMQLKRESVKKSQQVKLDEIADRFEREVDAAASARVSGTTDKDAISIQEAELQRQRQVAQKLRTVKAEGRIVLELESGAAQVKDLPDLPLQDGDSIFVPRKPGTVEVLGSVFQTNSFIFKPQRTVNDYVRMAGGATQSADTSETYVIHADGTASSRGRGWFTSLGGENVQPGDTIVVPETIERSTWRQSLKEWTAIFYQFGLGAAGLKVLQN